ncbi:saccharopine dehydrogenase NADP-binding domain-containing protein [Massilia aurea]|uniref:saccharopine dehydrogenase NADP-binding domain-containing protein n=1 Tax=Massilia aurea TaxID=373040 RepID=UPI00346216A2
MNTLMIYGATGYTGRMAAFHAKQAGLALIVAGRDGDVLAALAGELGVEARVFAADDAAGKALDGVTALLNCAGPFHRTAGPLMRACVANGVHYLDIAAELDSYQLAGQLDAQARAAGTMLLPGSGGSVAMLGGLVRHVIKRVAQPQSIAIALHVSGPMSRGSVQSASENMTATLTRAKGELVASDPHALRDFDFGRGPVSCFPVTLPDLITLWRDTQVADIATFVHVSGGAFPQGDPAALPTGPSDLQRAQHRYQVAVEMVGIDGTVHRAVLDTVNGYSFTPMAAVEAARRVLAGETRAGFQTPAGLFGEGFVVSIADSVITDGQATLA